MVNLDTLQHVPNHGRERLQIVKVSLELLEKDQAVTSNAYHWRKNPVELSSKSFTQKTLWKRSTDTTVARPLNIIIHVAGSVLTLQGSV